MKTWKLKLHLIAEELFQYSLITYLILLLAETLQEGFVSFFFDLNILLIVVLVSGVVMALTHHKELKSQKPKKITSSDVQNSILFAIGGGFLVYFKTELLGDISLLISLITAIIIFLLSILLLSDEA